MSRGRHPVLVSTFACMNVQARLFSIGFLADPAHGAFLVDAEATPDDQPLEDWRALYLARQRFDVRPDLDKFASPMLVIAGDQDRLVSLEDARELTAGIPRARLAVLPGAEHLINVETPGEFRRLVEDFLLG